MSPNSGWWIKFVNGSFYKSFAHSCSLLGALCPVWLVRFRSLHETASMLRFVVPVRHTLPLIYVSCMRMNIINTVAFSHLLGFYPKAEGPKRLYLCIEVHGVTSQQTLFFNSSCVVYFTNILTM